MALIKTYTRIEPTGEHFPDMLLGEEKYYAIDFSCWLTTEDDVLLSVDWELPDYVTALDQFVEDNIAMVKLKAERTGTYPIQASMVSGEDNVIQTTKVRMMLNVY